MAYELTTLAAVKRRLGIATAEEQHDTLLGEIIAEVSSQLQLRAGRIIPEETHTEYANGKGSVNLWLRQGPLVSVTSVHSIEYGDAGDGSREETPTLVDPYLYLLLGRLDQHSDGPARLVRRGASWSAGVANYKVVYVAGYATLPDQLVGDATRLCAGAFYDREVAFLRAKGGGDWSIEPLSPAALDEAIARLAAPWRYDWGIV